MSSSSSSSSSRECCNSVSFEETVTVRWHATVLGDHPVAKRGPPVSLDWKVVATDELPLRCSATKNDDDGANDDAKGVGGDVRSRRRSSKRMKKLSTEDRIKRVRNAGFSVEDIHLTIAECRIVRKQRKDTLTEFYDSYNNNPFDDAEDEDDVNDNDDEVDCSTVATTATTTATTTASSSRQGSDEQAQTGGRKRSKPSPTTKSLRRTERGGLLLAATMAAAFRKQLPIIDPSLSSSPSGANEKFDGGSFSSSSFAAPKKVQLPRSLLRGIKESMRVKKTKKAVQRRWLSPKVIPVSQ